MTGIYGIHNLVTNKWYVGQARDIPLRWKRHEWALDNGYHVNQHLLNSWRTYGKASFEFTVLELCEQEALNDLEIFWIDKLDSLHNGYNLTPGGYSGGASWNDITRSNFSMARTGAGNPMYGKHLTAEHKAKISDRERGSNNHMFGKAGSEHPRSKRVLCVETGVVYGGLREAERKTGINQGNISAVCHGRLKQAGGFHWKLLD